MNDMITLKLKNGADIVGSLVEEHEKYLLVNEPVEMQVDPEYGFFAKNYLLLAQGNVARFNKDDLLLMAPANEKAVRYYEEFTSRIRDIHENVQGSRQDFTPEDLEEIEETMAAMLESRHVTKH